MSARAGSGRATQSNALPVELATRAPIIAPARSARPSIIALLGPAAVLGIAGGLAAIYTCTTNNDQTWHSPAGSCHPTYPTYCMYVNGDSRCLAVNGGNIYNGSRILGFPCTGSLDQYWARTGAGDNLMNLKGGV